jgi:hypothetical protein
MDLPPFAVMWDFAPTLMRRSISHSMDGFDLFAHEVTLPEHVEEVVSPHPDEQSGRVGSEAMAPCLVPTQRILPLADPVLNVPAAAVGLDHLRGRELARRGAASIEKVRDAVHFIHRILRELLPTLAPIYFLIRATRPIISAGLGIAEFSRPHETPTARALRLLGRH